MTLSPRDIFASVPYLTQGFSPFPDAPHLLLAAFGPGLDGRDWGLGKIWTGNGARRSPQIREKLARVEEITASLDIERLLVPSVQQFNALVCSASDFVSSAKSPQGTLALLGGRFVDGVVVPQGYASWQASADCWTIAARNVRNKRAGTAHAGFASLYDMHFLKYSRRSRPDFSVVNALVEKLGGYAGDMEVFIACGIGARHYGHPVRHREHGGDNRELFNYCTWLGKNCAYRDKDEFKFDIPEIIKAQFVNCGVEAANIRVSYNANGRVTDTYGDTDDNGNFLWHSHRRDRTPKRNALLFVNAA